MRLLLIGGTCFEDVEYSDELFRSQIDYEKTMLYIPVAGEAHDFSYANSFNWLKKRFGINKMDMCIELKSVEDLNQYTAIYIGGGNTFKLLKEIKESKFDIKLLEYLSNGGFVYGDSAGAIIFGNSIKVAGYFDTNDVGLTDLSGLNLVNGRDIFCHYSDEDNETLDEDNEYLKNYDNDLYILYNKSGLFIKDNEVNAIGKPYLNKSEIL